MIGQNKTIKVMFLLFLGLFFLIGTAYFVQAELFLSTDIPVTIESDSFKERDVFSYDPPDFSDYIAGSDLGIPKGVNIDAFGITGTNKLFSVDVPTVLDGIKYSERDVILYNGTTFSKLLDGAAVGISEGARVDAATVLNDGRILFSLDIPAVVGGISFKHSDLIVYDNISIDEYLRGTDLSIPEEVNLDGVAEDPIGNILFSVDIPTELGSLQVIDKDIIEWNWVSLSLVPGGLSAGLPENTNVDACMYAECESNGECDDFNECTIDECISGSCEHTPVNDGTGCDDGQYCTINDECSEGDCIGSPRGCDDGFFCTGPEECDEAGDQCVSIGNPCPDDGEYCNGTESCNETTDSCENSGNPCPDDGLFCNGMEDCDEVGEQCINTGDPCPDDGEFCNGTESCNETIDSCENSGDPCLPLACDEVSDTCVGGVDSDSDGIPDSQDNCPDTPNGPDIGTCANCSTGSLGSTCTSDGDCGTGEYCAQNQEDVCNGDLDGDGVLDNADNCKCVSNQPQVDSYPPGGNNCGDACECEGNFDGDEDQDGSDAFDFKVDFGRSPLGNPCESGNPCKGDFDCDNDCDGSDAFTFKEDFGRSPFGNPCPSCPTDPWCAYP